MRFAETTALLAFAIERAARIGLGGKVMVELERSYRDAVAGDLKLKGRNSRAMKALERFTIAANKA